MRGLITTFCLSEAIFFMEILYLNVTTCVLITKWNGNLREREREREKIREKEISLVERERDRGCIKTFYSNEAIFFI